MQQVAFGALLNVASAYKLLSLTYKVLTITQLHTFITSSLFNVLVVLALNPSLLLLGHRHHPL